MNEMIFKGIWLLIAVIMIIYYAKRKHTMRSAVFGMVSGGGVLILLNFFGGFIGYSPSVNLFNTAVSLILGIPGAAVIMLVHFLC